MNLIFNVKSILRKYGIRPSKRLGQNFLTDKTVLKKIIEAAELKPIDTVLEIGPGIGTLTRALAEKAGKVIAVEKDRKMTEILKETLKEFRNIEFIHADIFKTNIQYLISNIQYKLVANLPYNVATAIIRKFLEAENPPQEMVLMVQKEVAQRICAKPPKMSLLAVSVQFYTHPVRKSSISNGAGPKIISYVSKKSFWPSPKVDSAIIKIKPSSPETRPRAAARGRVSGTENSGAKDLFFKIVKAGFSQPRKQLINNLASLAAPALASSGEASGQREGRERRGEQGRKREQREQGGREGKRGKERGKEKIRVWLLKNNIQPSQRAETLSVNDWINLTNTFK